MQKYLACSRLLVVLVALFIVGWGATAHARPNTLTLAEYRERLRTTEVRLRENPTKSERAQLADGLRNVVVADRPNALTVDTIDNRGLADAIAQADTEADQKKALQRLHTLYQVTAPVGTAPAPADIREQAAKILAGREFQRDNETSEHQKNWLDKWLDSVGKAIQNFLRWLFGNRRPRNVSGPDLSGLAAIGETVKVVLYLLATVAALVAVYFLVRLAMRYVARWQRKGRRSGDGKSDGDLADESIRDPLAEANRLAALGDRRGAVRFVYIACLRLLAQVGLLVMEPDKTNWEYQRALRGRSQTGYDALLPATRLFDNVWYGRRQATQDEYEAAQQVHAAVSRIVSDISSSGGGGTDTSGTASGNTRANPKGGNTW